MNSTILFVVHLTTNLQIMSNNILKMIPIKRGIARRLHAHSTKQTVTKFYKNEQRHDKRKRKIQLIESMNSNAITTIKLVRQAGTNLELSFIRISIFKIMFDIFNMKHIFLEFGMNRKNQITTMHTANSEHRTLSSIVDCK